jgi:tripartite-type tricarboxylate transporter receptor subunit TctC
MIRLVTTLWGRRTADRFIRSLRRASVKNVKHISYEEILFRGGGPIAHYIFADQDQLTRTELDAAAAFAAALTAEEPRARVLNRPTAVLTRVPLLRALHAEGINDFAVHRLELGEVPTTFPVFIRALDGHAGPESELIHDPDSFRRALRELEAMGVPLRDRIAVGYAAEPGPDGLFRKYGVFRIGDRMIPQHLMRSSRWVVKGRGGPVDEGGADEELDFVRSNPHRESARRAFEVASIDFGRADYGLVGGRPQFYEINTNPNFPNLGRPGVRAERRPIIYGEIRAALEEVDAPLHRTGWVRFTPPRPGTHALLPRASASGIGIVFRHALAACIRRGKRYVARRLVGAAAVATLAGCAPPVPRDEGVEEARAFFRGKTLTYIVAEEPGGNYDAYGRLIARHLTTHLGLRRVVVRNVPGGGGIRGANEIAAARPDGLTLGIFNTSLIYDQILTSEALRFDLRDLSWVGKMGSEPRVLVASTRSSFESVEDLRDAGRPILFGESGYQAGSHNESVLLAYALGYPARFVFGLPTAPSQLSMMRGEIEAATGSFGSYRRFVENGFGRFLAAVGEERAETSDIPRAEDLVVAPDGDLLVGLIRSTATLRRWTAGPPGIPEGRLALLREAHTAAVRDPLLVEEAGRLDLLPLAHMDGETLADEVTRLLSQPPEVLDAISAALGEPAASR